MNEFKQCPTYSNLFKSTFRGVARIAVDPGTVFVAVEGVVDDGFSSSHQSQPPQSSIVSTAKHLELK